MIKVNIHQAKTHLSRYLAELEPGDSIMVCKRNVPIAELRILPLKASEKRPIGLAKGRLTVPPEFFDALPDELIAAYEGEDRRVR